MRRVVSMLALIGVALELASCGGSGAKGTKYTEKVLYSFTGGADGGNPAAGVIFDSKGNLYGTTAVGNVVFELSPPVTPGNNWMFAVIGNIDGASFDPDGGALIQRGGNLYGESTEGNAGLCPPPVYLPSPPPPGCGYIFELSPPAAGTAPWSKTVLYAFTDSVGSLYGPYPYAGLTSDMNGNLYGMAGTDGFGGGVFELSPPSSGTGPWTRTVLNGLTPVASAIHGMPALDSQGNLYVNTYGTDGIGCGWIQELTSGNWGGRLVFDFTTTGPEGAAGCDPKGGVIFDKNGNLYGTADRGTGGSGVIFEFSPPINGNGAWTERVLYSFTGGRDGAFPSDRLVFDSQGNLYGTASGGGDAAGSCPGSNPPGCGLVFRLSPSSSGSGPWTETVLYTFTGGKDGGVPSGPVIFDSGGNIYGTAAVGGDSGNGVVFELIPSS